MKSDLKEGRGVKCLHMQSKVKLIKTSDYLGSEKKIIGDNINQTKSYTRKEKGRGTSRVKKRSYLNT